MLRQQFQKSFEKYLDETQCNTNLLPFLLLEIIEPEVSEAGFLIISLTLLLL